MGSIIDLIKNEMPLMLSGTVNYVWMIIIWMISGIIALFSGLNYKEIFNRTNFDLLLLVFMFPVCLLFFSFSAALMVVGVYFTGRLMLRFADKEHHMTLQLPMWVLTIVFVIGFGFTIYNIYKSDVSESTIEYSIEVQDSILLGEMPYEVKKDNNPKALLPGPFAYYISYIPYMISPLTTEFQNEIYYLTNFTSEKLDKFQIPEPQNTKLITFDKVKKQTAYELKFTDKMSTSITQEKVKQKALMAISQKSVRKINTMGIKIFQIFALIVLLSGLFFTTRQLASSKLAFFLIILVLFMPWKTVLLGGTWQVLAVGIFLFAVFNIKIMWLSGILLGLAVGINPILIVTLPLFINYYMPNIAQKGYWILSLGVMVFGLTMLLFAPHFKTEAFNFMPMQILGALIIFVGLAFSLVFSFLGNPLKRAPGSFFFAFLILLLISFFVVILNSHENSITDTVEIFAKGVLASSFITGAGILKTIAIPLFALLIIFHFLPRNIAQGGLIVLSAILVMFTILVLEIPMSGSEFVLLLPALFISHLKGSMLAEDKLTSIKLKESIDTKELEKLKESDSFEEPKLYGISDFATGDNSEDDNSDNFDDEIHFFGNSAFQSAKQDGFANDLKDDDELFQQSAEKESLMTTNALIDGLEREMSDDEAESIGDMVQDVLEQKKREEKVDE